MSKDRIQSYAPRHRALLESLHELSYAPQALADKSNELDYERQILQTAQADSADLEDQQRIAYEELQDFTKTSTRLAFKLRNPRQTEEKLASEALSREQKYQAVFSEGQVMVSRVRELEAGIERRLNELGDLSQLATRHAEIEGQLTVLYENVFGGPTPEYPVEDEAESSVHALEYHAQQLKGDVERRQDILDRYKVLIPVAEHAQRQFRKARDVFSGNRGAQARKAHHSEKAKEKYKEALRLEAMIVSMDPRIRPFDRPLPESGFWGGKYRERTEHCESMVHYYRLSMEDVAAQLHQLQGSLAQTERDLSESTAHLRDLRCSILQSYTSAEPLPNLTPLELDLKRQLA